MKSRLHVVPAVVILASASLTAVLPPLAPSSARADDLASFTSELDALDSKLEKVEAGDVPATNEVLSANSALQTRLVADASKGSAPWKALAQRSLDLDKKARARLQEALPAGNPGRHATAAKEKIDTAAQGLATLKAGDTNEAKRLLELLKESMASLAKAAGKARETDLWKACERRAPELDKAIRARYAGTDAPSGSSPPAAAAAADGLDLDADASGLSSTDTHYWKQFAAAYAETVAALRAGDLRKDATRARDLLDGVSAKSDKAVVRAKELLARFDARLAEARAAAEAKAKDQKEHDQLEAGDIEKQLAELDAYFAKDFSAKLAPPCDPKRVRAWIAKLGEWRALSAKGAAMIAKIKTDHPRFAADRTIARFEAFFAKGLEKQIARDIEHTVGRIVEGVNSQDGLLRARIARARNYLEGDPFTEANVSDDGWMGQALDELAQGVEACEALRIYRTEYQKKPVEPELEKLSEKIAAVRDKQTARATSLLENARLPAAATTDARTVSLARAAIVESGTPEADIVRLVVHAAPSAYEEKRSSTTEAGGDWIRIESWTERGQSMECTVAEKVKGEVRLVHYTLKLIQSGHPSSPKGSWFCGGRFEGRRIKPENVK